MSLSQILWDLHHSSDVGNAVEGLAELAEDLEKDLPIHKANTNKLAELALYCVQRRIGHEGQEAHEAIMLHCDALAAQVAILKAAYGNFAGAVNNLDEADTDSEEIIEEMWGQVFSVMQDGWNSFSREPQQCLAEIKAMAIEEAIGECLSAIDDTAAIKLVPFGYLLSEKWLLHYAEKIRRGDE